VRLLIVDPEASNGLDLALRAQKAGHDVKLSIRDNGRNTTVGKGFVPTVTDHRPWLRWSNLVVACGNNFYLRDLDAHRAQGGLVVSASQESAEWETTRTVGQKILQKCGIETLPCVEFHNYDDAMAHVKKTLGRYVSKPNWGGNVDKALSYVSTGPDDMTYMLKRWKKADKIKGSFILQDHCKGVEMGVAGWFGPGGWNEGWEENWEFKKLMNDDLGPGTGEQGTIMRYVRHSRLANEMLVPLTGELERAGYVGDIDVNCIIDEKGNPWPLEFTCRLGWPAFNLQCALVQGDPAEWLLDLAEGRDSRAMTYDKIAAGVVMSIPDYPYSKVTKKETIGMPVYGLTGNLWEHVHPCEMACLPRPEMIAGSLVEVPGPVTAGEYVLVMTAVADTVKDASLTAYRRLKRLTIPGSQMYRTDIGKRLRAELPKLQAHHYAMNLTYSQQP
jgi:phosphoribosylamine---glycine ligase